MRRCPVCRHLTTGPVCPADDHPTEDRDAAPLDAHGVGCDADRVLAAYAIEEYWGSDEAGGTYRARVLATGTPVALRVVRTDLSQNATYSEAFEQQVERCRALATHHVAKVLDHGRTSDGRLFVVNEYVQGRSLRQLTEAGRTFGWIAVREISLQLLEALSEAHWAGVVHWDLKPDVIFFEDAPGGEPPNLRVLGFGLPPRGAVGRDSVQPSPYAAPQRFAGGVIEERSDLYALGACLFHLLTGRAPAEARPTPHEARERRAGRRPRLAIDRTDLPQGYLDLLQRLLAWSPADRPGSAEDVKRAVIALPESVEYDEAGGSEPPSEGESPLDARQPAEPAADLLTRFNRAPLAYRVVGGLLVLAIATLVALLVSGR